MWTTILPVKLWLPLYAPMRPGPYSKSAESASASGARTLKVSGVKANGGEASERPRSSRGPATTTSAAVDGRRASWRAASSSQRAAQGHGISSAARDRATGKTRASTQYSRRRSLRYGGPSVPFGYSWCAMGLGGATGLSGPAGLAPSFREGTDSRAARQRRPRLSAFLILFSSFIRRFSQPHQGKLRLRARAGPPSPAQRQRAGEEAAASSSSSR
ncbi:hypothetical protein T492DRAFT_164376 [Pavlovales sp. CCMP2436]|nr:hypothetical protein T492DRAFT_164376 [Pavlovales sp. CCMP2436]